MMTNTKRISLALFTFQILLISLIPTGVFGSALPRTAKLLPPDTIFLIEVDDVAEFRTQFEKTSFYKLYKDPAMSAFVEDFKIRWKKQFPQLNDSDIFKTIVDAGVIPQGRFAIAAGQQANDPNEPSILAITQWGQNIEKIKEAVNKIIEKATEAGGHQKTEDYRSVAIKILINKSAETFYYCYIDDCFMAATDLDAVKFAIAQIKGAESRTLADENDYSTAIRAVGPYHDTDFYLNIKKIISVMLTADSSGQAAMITTTLGLDNITSLTYSLGFAKDNGIDIHGKAFMKIDGAKKGICKIMETTSTPIDVPGFIPPTSYSISFLNLDIKKAYDEIYRIAYNFSPMQAGLMLMPLLPPSPDGQPGLQLKPDIIDHFGEQIIMAQMIDKPLPGKTELPQNEMLIALKTNNRDALERSLARLHSTYFAVNNPESQRELLGHTVYLIVVPSLPFFTGGVTPMGQLDQQNTPQMHKLAFTVTNTHLILASERTVESAIRAISNADSASITSAQWFAKTKAKMPAAVGIASMDDNQASNKVFWEMIKQSDGTDLMNNPVGADQTTNEKIAELFNPKLLPEFDVIKKYFNQSCGYGITRPDGFFLEFKCLK